MNNLQQYDDQVIALSLHLGLTQEQIDDTDDYDSENLTKEQDEAIGDIQEKLDEAKKLIDDGDYLVYTDDEANDARVEAVENLLDDIEGEMIPNRVEKGYMQRDVRVEDGKLCVTYEANDFDRASELGRYDGEENEETVNGTTYYIYRQN